MRPRPLTGFEAGLVGCRPWLRRHARRLTRDVDRAEDLLQDTCLRALAGRGGFAEGTDLRAWLLALMRNLHLDGIRRDRVVATADDALLRMLPPARGGQGAALDLRDLDRALRALPPAMREAVELCALRGLDRREAAALAGVGPRTLASRLNRGRAALRRALGPG